MTAAQKILSANRGDFRQRLRAELGILDCLKRREVRRIAGEPVIHCEVYRHSATAPTLLFLPGLGTYTELYAELFCRLNDLGFNVVGVDPRGHGYSGGERGYYSVDDVVGDLQRVLDDLEPTFTGPFVLFGYSAGAISGLALAERDERIAALACGTLMLGELPPDLLHRVGWQWTWATARLFPRLRLSLKSVIDLAALLDGHPVAHLIDQDPLLVFEYPLRTLASLFSRRSGILTQRYPFQLAIFQGERDEVLDAGYARRVVASVEQPIDLMLLPGEGHMVPWDNPTSLAEQVGRWLHRILAECD